METFTFPRMVGDVGGTNARWAIQFAPDGPLCHTRGYTVQDFPSIGACIERFLAEHGCARPVQMALGVATAVTGDQVQLTNSPWRFSIAALQAELQLERLLVLNDFQALAMSLPALAPSGYARLGMAAHGEAVPRQPVVVVGPGTGLGVAALAWQANGKPMVISGEGGHATLAAMNDVQARVLDFLRGELEHVSGERILSGAGMVNLYRAACFLHGVPAEPLTPADVVQRCAGLESAQCILACSLFAEFLGSVAGNLALAFGARGGVYIGGGIVPKLGAAFDTRRFRAAFEGKGRLRSYLEAVPTWLITEAQPALIGASRALALQE